MMKVLDQGTPFASDVEVGTGVVWLPYKAVHQAVTQFLQESSADAYSELENSVLKYKSDFINFLNYRGKSSSDRELLKKAITDGIFLRGNDMKQPLHPQLVNETLLLSDMFDINEFLALDMLATAETLVEEYPGWTRGLIAVLLYYEGRLCMIQTISSIVMAMPGRTWHQELFPRGQTIFQTILDYVLKDDMMDSLIELFERTDTKAQLEILDNNLALGDWRHRHEVTRMVNGIREGIAFIIYATSAQRELPWKDTLRLIEYLKSCVRPEDDFKVKRAEGALLAAVMFSISNNMSLPDYDRNYAKELQKYLKDTEPKTPENNGFQCFEVFEFIRLNYHIVTHKAISETNINSIHGVNDASHIIKDDEDFCFKKDLFSFMRHRIFSDLTVFSYEANMMKRYHTMFTDFITYMPMKVKEMKVRSEDAAKTATLYHNQGFSSPPNLPQDYESFLECLGAFYSEDNAGLAASYFNPDTRNLALNKLARGACTDNPTMFVPNAKLLSGLARGSPDDVFDLLKQNGHNFSFEHFFESILKYLSSFGANNQAGMNGPNVYTSEAYQRVVMDPMRVTMNPAEINGICAYLDLVKALCDNSTKVSSFFTNQKLPWIRTILQTAKVRAIPREIRARMITAAAGMLSHECSPETVNSVWEMFYSTRLIGQENGDLKDELDEHESRLETYSLTISMLKLLDSLIKSRFQQTEIDANIDLDGVENLDNGAFDPYVSFIRDTVLLKALYRSYKNVEERWEIASLSLEIMSKLLDYVPQLMFQLLCGSSFLRTILTTLADCVRVREASSGYLEKVDRCAFGCLNLLRRALHRQGYFLHRREFASGRPENVIVGMQELLMKVIPETGRPEYMLSILKYIDNLQPPLHKQAALDIVALTLVDRDDIDSHLYAAVISDSNLVALLRHMFISTLYEPPCFDDIKKLVLQIIRVSVVHSVPNFGMMLLGVDKKVDFQNAGVGGYPRTVLHAILDNAPNLPDAFATLLTLMRDPRLWKPLIRYLKTNHFFSTFLRENFPSPTADAQDIGNLLKCIAVELKTSPVPGPLASAIIGEECGKFQEVLNMLELDRQNLEIPDLEYFDAENVMNAMKSCEYFDSKLKIRVIRVDMLENLLKAEIAKLEKTTVLRLRHTVHGEAKEVVAFAKQFNSSRLREASKMNMFDGWRQCLEVLVLSPGTLSLAGVDFVTSILRLLLIKVVGTTSATDYFCRLAAETVLTLCAVMGTFKDQVNATTLNVILGYICKWISEEQSPRVRATLYAAILHVVKMFKDTNEAGSACVKSFSLILEHLSKDCCQSAEFGKMQAMYLMGEIIRLNTERGLGGGDELSTSWAHRSRKKVLPNGRRRIYSSRPIDFDLRDHVLDGDGFENRVSRDEELPPRIEQGALATDYFHLNIMTYMFAKGFLGNLVDAICMADDPDLTQLFSNQPVSNHMKALYVFEAKMSLLSRFAATGVKSILVLMDINLVHKLTDMNVLQVQCYQDEDSSRAVPELGAGDFVEMSLLNSTLSGQTHKGVIEALFTNILKLLHVMVESAPKNVLLVEQIWHFLDVHDVALSYLVSRQSIRKDEPNVGTSLLVTLLAKCTKVMPMAAFTKRTNIMSRMLDILKLQAVQPSQSDCRIKLVKDTLIFLYQFANNADHKRNFGYGSIRPVLSNKMDHDMLVGNPDDELTIGVVVKIICDAATMLLGNHTSGEMANNKIEWITTIIEAGMVLTHSHSDVFLTSPAYRNTSQAFRDEFRPILDNKLAKYTQDATRIVPGLSFVDMFVLPRIQRLVHAPTRYQ